MKSVNHWITHLRTLWSRVFLEKLTGSPLVKFPAFYGTPSFISAFTIAATSPYPAPDQSSPWLPSHFLKTHLNIVHTSTPRSSKKSTKFYIYIYICIIRGLFKALCKTAKATVGFATVRPSTWYNSALTGRILMEYFSKNLLRKFKFHYFLKRITRLYMKAYFWCHTVGPPTARIHLKEWSARRRRAESTWYVRVIRNVYRQCMQCLCALSRLVLYSTEVQY